MTEKSIARAKKLANKSLWKAKTENFGGLKKPKNWPAKWFGSLFNRKKTNKTTLIPAALGFGDTNNAKNLGNKLPTKSSNKSSDKSSKNRVFAPTEEQKAKALNQGIYASEAKNPVRSFFSSKQNKVLAGSSNIVSNRAPNSYSTILEGGKNGFSKIRQLVFSFVNNFASTVATILLFGFGLTVVYYTFLDNTFTLNQYTIGFSQGSYLNPEQTRTLTQVIQTQKQLGFLPQNQYWYINSPSLTLSSREFLPQIKSIAIKNKTWNSAVELEIEVEPALITLGVIENGQLKFWRVDKNGFVLGQDVSGIYENLVMVQTPLSIASSENLETTSTQSNNNTLQSYNFENNLTQLNRFYFSIWVKNFLNTLGYQNFSLSFPSLSDEDVVATLASGSQIYFNSTAFDSAVQARRFQSVLTTKFNSNSSNNSNSDSQNTIANSLEAGTIHYLDLRIPKRVFICQKNTACAN